MRRVQSPLRESLRTQRVELTLREWVNSGLMTFIFFVLGLQARGYDLGDFRERRRLVLPSLGSLGGMGAAVAIYFRGRPLRVAAPAARRRASSRRAGGTGLGGRRRSGRVLGDPRPGQPDRRGRGGADLRGVSGTPTFFINGRRHHGAYDIDTLSRAVRAAGARAKLVAS